MDDLTKSLIREMIRDELARQLPAALSDAVKGLALPPGPEGPEGPRGKRGLTGKSGPAADLAPLQQQVDGWLQGAEARVHDLVNATESRVSAHLAARQVVTQGSEP